MADERRVRRAVGRGLVGRAARVARAVGRGIRSMAGVVKTWRCGLLIIAMAGLPCAASATTTTLAEFPLSANSGPTSIATGPDGNLWFTESGESRRISPGGAITGFSLPANNDPLGIAAGPDGNLWFTVFGTAKIGQITPAGVIREFGPAPAGPVGPIIAGPDGNLWFTE